MMQPIKGEGAETMTAKGQRKKTEGGGDPGPERARLLVVDDDEQIIKQIRWALEDDYELYTAGDRPTALRLVRKHGIPLVLLDLGLPPRPRTAEEGLAALEAILALDPLAKVIIVSGNSERSNAVLAVQRGAYDIFPKPVDLDSLRVVLDRVRRKRELEVDHLHAHAEEACGGLIGSSEPMRRLYAMVRRVALSGATVQISGESGAGKELVARAIHDLSPRAKKPFVAVNCGAIPAGLLESELFGHEKGAFTGASEQRVGRAERAQGGTLFLDEIAEMPLELQVKLLRFIQERTIERVGGRTPIPLDVRILSASNRDLEEEVRTNRFREDLFYRLSVVTIEVPPLRDRGDDVVELAHHFLAQAAREAGRPLRQLSPDARESLLGHAWPGNVRELQNRIQRAFLLADGEVIGPRDLDLAPSTGEGGGEASGETGAEAVPTLKEARETMERDLVRRALAECDGNVSRAARALGVSRPTLYEIMERLGLRSQGKG